MRQRVLQATIITVLLAVAMLGIPLATSWLQVTRIQVDNDATSVLTQVTSATDDRLSKGDSIDAALLQGFVDEETRYSLYITVSKDGGTVTAGQRPADESPLTKGIMGNGGQQVTVMIPSSDIRAQAAGTWVMIAVAGLSAISIGISVALWQAQRLSAPLARLTRRAEELGSGRARSQWEPSGIAEIDTVADELARSGAELSERLEAESRLASDASHQLRTPLTALSMRLDEILATSSEEWVREEARISLEQIDRLTEVVHDLINAPRSSQRRTPGVVELRTLLTQQSEEWSPAFRAAGRELRIQVPRSAAVWGSSGPLTQVVATLVENSLAHGGGRTVVKVRRNDHSTVIEVSDEGAGIDPALGKRVFERSVSGRSSQGTGVGLALARTLVEDDGGRLELLAERPATFGVFLISAPGDEDPGHASDAPEHDSLGTLPQGGVVSRRGRRRPHASPRLGDRRPADMAGGEFISRRRITGADGEDPGEPRP
ncbi:ATP-binding protein [Brachybacterium hainanense]|uniref:Signal transduction histidine-protein kinase/phosphatase MprB n=1 Tax=Brachybacterium hainanense TaxID=1541174 RepID=A0ABV6RE57_9MICO